MIRFRILEKNVCSSLLYTVGQKFLEIRLRAGQIKTREKKMNQFHGFFYLFHFSRNFSRLYFDFYANCIETRKFREIDFFHFGMYMISKDNVDFSISYTILLFIALIFHFNPTVYIYILLFSQGSTWLVEF